MKILQITYFVQTRHPERPRTPVDDVPIEKCTICGEQRLTAEGKTLLSVVQRSILREMQTQQTPVLSPFELFQEELLPSLFGQVKRIFSVK